MLSELIGTISSWVLTVIDTLGYGGVFVLMALDNMNVPIPSELVLPFAGYLASANSFYFWSVVFVATVGSFFGSLVSYVTTFYFGKRPLHFLARIHFLHPEHITKAEEWFTRYGAASVFFARFVPALRTFISLPAGVFRMNIWVFSGLSIAGSFGWSLFLTYVGFVLGENWHLVSEYLEPIQYVVLLVVAITLIWWGWKRYRKAL